MGTRRCVFAVLRILTFIIASTVVYYSDNEWFRNFGSSVSHNRVFYDDEDNTDSLNWVSTFAWMYAVRDAPLWFWFTNFAVFTGLAGFLAYARLVLIHQYKRRNITEEPDLVDVEIVNSRIPYGEDK